MAAGDATAYARAIHVDSEELTQRRVVQKRLRRRQHQATRHQREHPVRAGAQHVHRIDMKHLVGAEIGPDPLQSQNGTPPVVRF